MYHSNLHGRGGRTKARPNRPLGGLVAVLLATLSAAPAPLHARECAHPRWQVYGAMHAPQADFPLLVAAGFDTVFGAPSTADAESVRTWLDACWAHGLRAILAFGSSYLKDPTTGALLPDALERFWGPLLGGSTNADIRAHPALAGVMVLDEPYDPANWGGVRLTKADLVGLYQAFQTLAPGVPMGIGLGDPAVLGPYALDEPPAGTFFDFASFTFTLRKDQLAGGFTAYMADQRQALLETWLQARPDTWFVLMLQAYGMSSGGSSIPMPSADWLRQVLDEANPLAIRGVLFNSWASPKYTETIGDRIQAELSSGAGPYLDAVRHGATLCSDGEPGPPRWEPPVVADGQILLRFTARPGMSHTVEYATELPAINWNVLTRVPETAEAVEVVVADPVGPLARFYRIRSP